MKLLKGRKKTFTAMITIITSTTVLIIPGCSNVIKNKNTLDTFTKYDNLELYSIEYKGDYAFDDFLKVGAKDDNKLAQYITDNLLDGTDIEIKAPGAGCTTFSGKIETGDRIFARNFDFNSAIPMVVKTNPSTGYKSISTVNLEFIGYSANSLPDADDENSLLPLLATPYMPLDGVNEKGLAIGVLQINWLPALQADENKVTLPTTAMMRMVLDKAATVDEAIMLMRKYNIADSLGSNFHYQIADKTGKSVIVEYVANPVFNYKVDMIVIEPDKNIDYQFAENFLLSPLGNLIQSQLNPSGIGPKTRYGILKDGLRQNSGIFTDMQDAMSLLKQADQKTRTHWSVVYNLNKSTSLFVAKTKHDKPLEFAV